MPVLPERRYRDRDVCQCYEREDLEMEMYASVIREKI